MCTAIRARTPRPYKMPLNHETLWMKNRDRIPKILWVATWVIIILLMCIIALSGVTGKPKPVSILAGRCWSSESRIGADFTDFADDGIFSGSDGDLMEKSCKSEECGITRARESVDSSDKEWTVLGVGSVRCGDVFWPCLRFGWYERRSP